MNDPSAGFDAAFYEQYCFACGHQNPIGLHLSFAPDGEGGVFATYEPRREDQGFPGVMHGGVAASLLDEAMAWAMFASHRVLGVTAKMEMRYRRAIDLDGPLTLRGRVTRQRGRRIEVEASLANAGGDRLVEATSLYLSMSGDEESRVLAAMGWDAIPGGD
jgi:acyl-coenzyme A thioesterase PaaI-like protein